MKMTPPARRLRHGVPVPVMLEPWPAVGGSRSREVLGGLFPVVPEAPTVARSTRVLGIVVQVAAVGIASGLMLLRVPGLPSWRTIYGEDYPVFFTGAIQQPWHLIQYAGYVQVLPQTIAQIVRYLPLADASLAFAVTGAAIAACCALFIFHASAGHIQQVKLRALLAVALVLLPTAPLEIIDSGVDTIWYLLAALFWAMLWRPRTPAATAVAGVIGFVAAASNVLAVLLAPLVAVRLYVLRRPREHVVSVGWLAGCIVQVPFVIQGIHGGRSRLGGHRHATPGQSLAFYGHAVLLPSLGWHLSWWLRSLAGVNGATAIAVAVLVVIFGAILATQPQARPFVVTALTTGFVFAVISVTMYLNPAIVKPLPTYQDGSRYTVLPTFLIVSALIVGAGHALRSPARGHRIHGTSFKPVMAVAALVVFLASTWAVDFQYAGLRSQGVLNWAPIAAKWEHDCAHSSTGKIIESTRLGYKTLPCRNITP